jgi:hypothetical protein
VNWRLLPFGAVGSAIDCTRTPAGVYSSRNTACVVFDSVVVPSPTRTVTRLPRVSGDWAAMAAARAAMAARERKVGREVMVWLLDVRSRRMASRVPPRVRPRWGVP